jgi:hypothetical protein
MIEKALRKEDRERIRNFARERWEARMRHSGMNAQNASMVQQDVERFIRRQKVGNGIIATILMNIAIRFAQSLIRKWLNDWMVQNEGR